jgi:hypothetical protein
MMMCLGDNRMNASMVMAVWAAFQQKKTTKDTGLYYTKRHDLGKLPHSKRNQPTPQCRYNQNQ